MKELSESCLPGAGKSLGDVASGNTEVAGGSIGLETAGARRVDTSEKRLGHLAAATRINCAANFTVETGVEHYAPR